MSNSVSLLSNMQKPSWCLLVIVMYFAPAALASLTQTSASKRPGLNRGRELVVLADRQLVVFHHPLALAHERIDPPVDEEAEAVVFESTAGQRPASRPLDRARRQPAHVRLAVCECAECDRSESQRIASSVKIPIGPLSTSESRGAIFSRGPERTMARSAALSSAKLQKTAALARRWLDWPARALGAVGNVGVASNSACTGYDGILERMSGAGVTHRARAPGISQRRLTLTSAAGNETSTSLVHEGWDHLRSQRPLAAWASWQRALRVEPDSTAAPQALCDP